MGKHWWNSLLSVVLAMALVLGSVSVSAIEAQAQGQHGPAGETINKKDLKNTPPSSEEYDVDMSMQKEAKEGAYNAYFLKDDIQTVKIDVDETNLNYLLQNAGD